MTLQLQNYAQPLKYMILMEMVRFSLTYSTTIFSITLNEFNRKSFFLLFLKKLYILPGNITADEMHEIIEKCDINLTYDQFQDLIDNLDKNNDGKIVFEGKLIDSLPIEKVFQGKFIQINIYALEFISVMAKKMSSVNKKKDLETTFNYFDRDGSGSIDRSEIYEIMKRFKKGITQEQVDIIMAQIDTDGSGKVNFEGMKLLFFKKMFILPVNFNFLFFFKSF